MAYKILHHRLFEKEVLKIPRHHQQKVYQILISLKENPIKIPPNTTPLTGYKNVYRTRVGSLRLIYQLVHGKKTILVLGINPRGNIYKIIRRLLS